MVIQYFNINDIIIKDSIKAIATATSDNRLISPLIVGGIAIQLHCRNQENLFRSTSDIDLSYIPDIPDYSAFNQGLGTVIKNSLMVSKYQVQLQKVKNRAHYVVRIMNGQGNKAKELFFIHIDKTQTSQGTNANPIKLREIINSTEIHYEGNRIYVPRIEDIIPLKLKRIQTNIAKQSSAIERALYSMAENGNWSQLSNISLTYWRDTILQSQNTITATKNELYRNYHINKDLYDLCLLAQIIESSPHNFNQSYYLKSKSEISKF